MKGIIKVFLFCYLFLFSSFSIIAQSVSIGVVNPFLYQNSTETLLIKSNLVFELFSANNGDKFLLKNLNCSGNSFEDLQQNAFYTAAEESLRYIFMFKTYNLYGNVILQVYLFDINKSKELYKKNYPIEFNIKINESIAVVAEQIITDVLQVDFEIEEDIIKPKTDKTKKAEKKGNTEVEKERIENLLDKEKFKHELFVSNGFLKVNSQTLTLASVYTGYSFYASDFIYMDVGGCLGFGKKEAWFDFSDWQWNSFYAGGFAGFHFYLKGWFEPNIGGKVEILYNSNENVFLSIPFEIGLKIHLAKRHVLRISGVFPIMSLNLTDYQWDNQLTLGFLIGYGVKL